MVEAEALPQDHEIIDTLSGLLPAHVVNVRVEGGFHLSYVRSLAVKMLRDALANGFVIDRTNEDGPLAEWDGWLVIHGRKGKTFIETNWKAKN